MIISSLLCLDDRYGHLQNSMELHPDQLPLLSLPHTGLIGHPGSPDINTPHIFPNLIFRTSRDGSFSSVLSLLSSRDDLIHGATTLQQSYRGLLLYGQRHWRGAAQSQLRNIRPLFYHNTRHLPDAHLGTSILKFVQKLLQIQPSPEGPLIR